MLNLGVFCWFGYELDYEQRFKLIKEAGFDSIMLWWGEEFTKQEGIKDLLTNLARNNDLLIENIHLPWAEANDIWKDNLDGEELTKVYFEYLNDCRFYEIKTVIMHLTKGFNPPPANELGINRLKKLASFAEENGVQIALENLECPDYLDVVFPRLNNPSVGLCYDIGHENCYSKKWDILEKYGNRLMALHLHDNNGIDDQHLIPGDGIVDWEKLKSAVTKLNYSGSLSLEIINKNSVKYETMDAREFLRNAYNQAQQLFQ